MKTKNLILGLCAIAFAIGSAFASYSPDPDFDSVTVEELSEPCQVIDEIECNMNSTQPCQVEVFVGTVSQGAKDVYDLPSCSEPKTDDRQQPIDQIVINP